MRLMTGFEDVQISEEHRGEAWVTRSQGSPAGGQPLLLAFSFLQPSITGWDVCADDLEWAACAGDHDRCGPCGQVADRVPERGPAGPVPG